MPILFNYLINACVVPIERIEGYRLPSVCDQILAMSARVCLDSSIILTTALKRPISSPKLAVSSETPQKILDGDKPIDTAVYPVPHCVLLTALEATDSNSLLLESALVSEEAIALMVKELELENLRELPELHIEFSDWPAGVTLPRL